MVPWVLPAALSVEHYPFTDVDGLGVVMKEMFKRREERT